MTITVVIPTLPAPPLRSNPTNFAERADNFLGALPNYGVALNQFATEANGMAADINQAATSAQASADAAAQVSEVSAWISDGPYSVGQAVWSPNNFKTYRNKTGTNTTTAPDADATNWAPVSGQGDALLVGTQEFTGSNTFSGAATTISNLFIGSNTGKASVVFSSTNNRTVTLVDPGADSQFVLTAGDQVIAGIKQFSGKVLLSNGLASSPSIAFSSDGLQDTGFYWGGTDGTFMIANNGVKSGEFQSGGNLIMVGNVTGYSDERLKTDWVTPSHDFIHRLAQVKTGTYTRVDTGDRQAGVSAQSLQEVLPEAVTESVSGMLSVAYGNAALYTCVVLAKEVVRLKGLVSKLLEE